MYIKDIALWNFRNYEYKKLELLRGVNVILGENATGKTNLAEAIYMMSGSQSWRTVKKAELVRIGQVQAQLLCHANSDDRDWEIKLVLDKTTRPHAYVNGIKKTKTAELAQMIKCVVFSPEDLQIVGGGSALRRGFVDRALCQLRPRYRELLTAYNKVYDSKTKMLKLAEERPDMLLVYDEYTEKMAGLSAQIIQYRHRFLRELTPVCVDIHAQISSGREKLSLKYKTVSSVTDTSADANTLYGELMAHAQSHRTAEISSKMCLSGVHKDDIEIEINDKTAKGYASQGQTRTAALSLKMAERELFFIDDGNYPILILDDVLSELDRNRRDFLLGKIENGQVIITSCYDEGDHFPKGANIIEQM